MILGDEPPWVTEAAGLSSADGIGAGSGPGGEAEVTGCMG